MKCNHVSSRQTQNKKNNNTRTTPDIWMRNKQKKNALLISHKPATILTIPRSSLNWASNTLNRPIEEITISNSNSHNQQWKEFQLWRTSEREGIPKFLPLRFCVDFLAARADHTSFAQMIFHVCEGERIPVCIHEICIGFTMQNGRDRMYCV